MHFPYLIRVYYCLHCYDSIKMVIVQWQTITVIAEACGFNISDFPY